MADAAALRRAALLWSGLALLAATLFVWHVSPLLPWGANASADPASLDRVLLVHGALPRAAVAILAGLALGLSGLIMQRVLRNPLAEPSTLGVSAGAQLAMGAATLYAPALMANGREGVALAGGLAAVALILALTWRRGLEPVAVVLSGMMVALTATAATSALILANGEYVFSLLIWGGGALEQQSWGPAGVIASRLVLAAVAAILLLRPLAILALDDASARSLGLSLHAMRLAALLIAVWLATTVVSEVGVIGFVGLAAPALAMLSGVRTLPARLIAAPLIGAILLWLTDGLVQLTPALLGSAVPTGAATALLGGPLLLWLLPRLRLFEWPVVTAQPPSHRTPRPWRLILALFIGGAATALAALALGIGPHGWTLATGDLLADLAAWRAPRISVAIAAGMMLGMAGSITQRITGNPLAGPEILGLGMGAGVGIAVSLFLGGAASLGAQLAAASAGAIGALLIILAIARRSGFGPDRLLLGGIAMSAVGGALLTALIAIGSPQSYALLRWMAGSTNDAAPMHAWMALAATAVLCAPLLLAGRWLDILPLGESTGRGLGLPLGASRLALIVEAGLLTAAASLLIGPLSFMGLIAPHIARALGLWRALPHLIGSALIGAGLLTVSDWLSRMVAFPYQLPLGLFAALLAGPYLIYLVGKGASRHG